MHKFFDIFEFQKNIIITVERDEDYLIFKIFKQAVFPLKLYHDNNSICYHIYDHPQKQFIPLPIHAQILSPSDEKDKKLIEMIDSEKKKNQDLIEQQARELNELKAQFKDFMEKKMNKGDKKVTKSSSRVYKLRSSAKR